MEDHKLDYPLRPAGEVVDPAPKEAEPFLKEPAPINPLNSTGWRASVLLIVGALLTILATAAIAEPTKTIVLAVLAAIEIGLGGHTGYVRWQKGKSPAHREPRLDFGAPLADIYQVTESVRKARKRGGAVGPLVWMVAFSILVAGCAIPKRIFQTIAHGENISCEAIQIWAIWDPDLAPLQKAVEICNSGVVDRATRLIFAPLGTPETDPVIMLDSFAPNYGIGGGEGTETPAILFGCERTDESRLPGLCHPAAEKKVDPALAPLCNAYMTGCPSI